jgi:hypothetical protein
MFCKHAHNNFEFHDIDSKLAYSTTHKSRTPIKGRSQKAPKGT